MFFDRFKKYKYDNTRRHLRLPAAWPIKCEPLPTEEKRPLLSTKDVSAGGVAVVLRGMIPVGTHLRIEIHVPPLSRTLSAEGQVVRTGAQGDSFELGVRFVQMNPEDRQALDEAIEKFYSPKERARQQGTRWRRLP